VILANSKRFRSAFALHASANKRLSRAAIAAATIFTVLAVASLVPAWAAEQPTVSTLKTPPPSSGYAAAARADRMATRKGKNNDVGIRGHGFVTDNGVFTTIDHPDASSKTLLFGINNRGQIVGAFR
jgi:hypothetical protein